LLIIPSTSSEIPWFSSSVLSFESIPRDSLKEGIQHGHTYTSVVVNVPMYLNFLYETAQSHGAVIIRATLPECSAFSETLQAATDVVKSHLKELGSAEAPQISAFVNATGISASKLVPDANMYPVRGQTITVRGEANQITTFTGLPSDPTPYSTPITYILPRPHSNTTILGGTKQVGDWNAEADPQTTEEILRRAKEWAPELLNKNGEFEVLSVQVGLRPGRKGGARVEIESLNGAIVCHAYGHAGAGYQNSVGSANKVVGLLEKHFQDGKSG
jgi:D-amino-acid oxidase